MGWKTREPGAVETLEEWRPFLRVAREMRLEGEHWTLDPLDFRLAVWIERKGRPRLSVYVHVATGGDIVVDPEGRPYRVTVDRANRIRAKLVGVGPALWWAGVPEFELAREPRHNGRHPGWDTCDACRQWLEEEDAVWLAEQEELRERRRVQRAARAARSAANQGAPVAPSAPARHLRVVGGHDGP
jgi:hypothetical protein